MVSLMLYQLIITPCPEGHGAQFLPVGAYFGTNGISLTSGWL
jgi:hypothetical protein